MGARVQGDWEGLDEGRRSRCEGREVWGPWINRIEGKEIEGRLPGRPGIRGPGRSSDAGLPVVWGWKFQGSWGVRRPEVRRQGWGSVFP